MLFVVSLSPLYTMLFKLWRGLVGVGARPDLLRAKSMNVGVKGWVGGGAAKKCIIGF